MVATIINLFNLNGANGFRLDGVAEGRSGNSGNTVSNAGDVNGDGFADVIIGESGADPNGLYSGSSYVVFSKASGFDAVMSLSDLDGSNGFRLDGGEGDYTGNTISIAGDVNGDGFDDLIAGAPQADFNDEISGSTYVLFGRKNFSDIEAIVGTFRDGNLIGTTAVDRFKAGGGNDRMIGHGGADVFHGSAGDDYIRVRDLNFKLVNGGSGNDILGLGGKDLNLNLADFRDKIKGIETIYLYGNNSDNTLTVNAADLLNLSDTSNTLKVLGNAGDRVVGLSNIGRPGDWEDGGIKGNFHVFTHDEAVLLVGVNVTTDFV